MISDLQNEEDELNDPKELRGSNALWLVISRKVTKGHLQ